MKNKLYRMVRLLNKPKEQKDRVYRRYITWSAGRIERHGPGETRPELYEEMRNGQLAINKFNKGD